jgi:hypothetical protein
MAAVNGHSSADHGEGCVEMMMVVSALMRDGGGNIGWVAPWVVVCA